MGVCASSEDLHKAALLPVLKRDEFALQMFTKIGLTNAEVRKFCTMFDEINTDKSGIITSVELLSYLDMELDDLSIKILSPFDAINVGTLTFCEFTCALWNFLSMDTRNLPSFVFHLFDQERLFILNYTQLKSALKVIHQKSTHDREILNTIMEEMQGLTPMTRPIFRKYCQRNPFLCQPVVSLQQLMRKNVFGELFWSILCRRRLGDTNLLEADYLFKIRDHATKKVLALSRTELSLDIQDQLDGLSKSRLQALERFRDQKKNSPTKNLAPKSNPKSLNHPAKVVPVDDDRVVSEDPVEVIAPSLHRRVALTDLEEQYFDSDTESPSLCGTSTSLSSREYSPSVQIVLASGSGRLVKISYSPMTTVRKAKSVLRRESTYLASDSAEESESSGNEDLANRIRRKRKKSRPKKTVRFSEVNTYYESDTFQVSNDGVKAIAPPALSVSVVPTIVDVH
jgi:Ca2+-binding EF-hand superfamily protein